jgi:hypothetical protein
LLVLRKFLRSMQAHKIFRAPLAYLQRMFPRARNGHKFVQQTKIWPHAIIGPKPIVVVHFHVHNMLAPCFSRSKQRDVLHSLRPRNFFGGSGASLLLRSRIYSERSGAIHPRHLAHHKQLLPCRSSAWCSCSAGGHVQLVIGSVKFILLSSHFSIAGSALTIVTTLKLVPLSFQSKACVHLLCL